MSFLKQNEGSVSNAFLFLEHSIWQEEEGKEGAKSCCQLESKLMVVQRTEQEIPNEKKKRADIF